LTSQQTTINLEGNVDSYFESMVAAGFGHRQFTAQESPIFMA